jgi:hypothetical protein
MNENSDSVFYPDERMLYTHYVGETGETVIKEIVSRNTVGFLAHEVCDNGADIQLKDLPFGAEIWNWRAPHCYNTRTNSVIKNLEEYQYRILVCSFINSNTERRLKEEQIEVVPLGFQILPAKYLESFKGHVPKGVKFDNRRTRKVVTNRLKPLTDKIKSLVLSKHDSITVDKEPDTPYVYSSIDNCSNIENIDSKHIRNTSEKTYFKNTEPPVDALLPVFNENIKETLNANRHLSDSTSFISFCKVMYYPRFYTKIKNWILRAIGKALGGLRIGD